jgi:hypothetical protein
MIPNFGQYVALFCDFFSPTHLVTLILSQNCQHFWQKYFQNENFDPDFLSDESAYLVETHAQLFGSGKLGSIL